MAVTAIPGYIFGGVRSNGNALNGDRARALRCRNWQPKPSGELWLRNGYSAVDQDTVVAQAIIGLWPYQLWNGTRYLIFHYGTTLKRLALSDGTVTTITSSLGTSSPLSVFYADNKIYFGNADIQKFYDGTTLRNSGIRAVAAADISSVGVKEGTREPTSGDASGVTLTPQNSGGAFPVATSSGYQFYMVYLDTSNNDRGPARAIGSRQTFTSGSANRVDLTGLPNLSGVNTNWVKLFARTADGGGGASFCGDGTSATISTIVRASNVITVTTTGAHGLSTGDVVALSGFSGADALVGVYSITSTGATTFTCAAAGNAASSSGGSVDRLYKVANATTTGSITSFAAAQGGASPVNQERGIPATSVGGSQPGCQFYIAIYNPTTGQVGNRYAIGGRIAPANRSNVVITGLPDLSGTDSEWVVLIGRTGDGAEVPHVIADAGGNWVYAASAQTSLIITDGIDGETELPTRNTPPDDFDKFARVGDRVYANEDGSSDVFYCPTFGDEIRGTFVGRTSQSWPADNYERFPSAEEVSNVSEYDHECHVHTLNDYAILSEISGLQGWRGPWPGFGCAGKKASCNTRYGRFWLTGEKELATNTAQGPVIVSEEYQNGTLSRIDDDYLANTELVYQVDQKLGLDRILIKGQDSSGNPFIVVHDFKLRDADSPFGQGYEIVFVGALASNFILCRGRDADGKYRVFAGGSNGQIYVLDSGGDDAGTDFDADYVALQNLGEENKVFAWMTFTGDANLDVFYSNDLEITDAELSQQSTSKVEIQPNDGVWRITPDNMLVDSPGFFRLTLTSHPDDADDADDPMALSAIPHLPVETYGRVLGVKIGLADPLGH